MDGGLRLGSIRGLEIRINWSWFVIFILLAWSLSVGVFPGVFQFSAQTSWVLGVLAALLLFVSVLVHEVAHALVARKFGLEIREITLWIFGGVAQMREEPPTPKAEFLIAVVGPIVSIAIGIVCLVASALLTGQPPDPALPGLGMSPAAALFSYLGGINIFLALFNLVPGFPLDGGRILRAGIWHFTGSLRKATQWASYAGQAFAWLLIGYGLVYQVLLQGNLGGLWLAFIGWFLNTAAQSGYQQLLIRRALCGVRVADLMDSDPIQVSADMSVADFVDRHLIRSDYTLYPISRDHQCLGVVTLDDVRQLDRSAWESTPLEAIMHPAAAEQQVPDSADAWDALTQMLEGNRERILVTRSGELIGAISRDTLIRLVRRKLELEAPGKRVTEPSRASASRKRGLGT